MTTDIKELVKRLREVFVQDRGHGHTTEYTRNLDGPDAADALEALAGEVAGLNIVVTGWIEAFDKQEARAEAAEAERDRLKEALDKAGSPQLPAPASAYVEMRDERDRLKAVLKPRLNAKAIEGLQEILEAMEAMDEREAPFLKTLLDWHEAARKALGDAS